MTNDLIPKAITDLPTLQQVAEVMAEATKEVRTLEANRLDLTKDLNATLKKINASSKTLKAPHEEVIEKAEKALSDWRLTPEVQEGVANIRALERQSREAAKEGDEKGVALIAQRIEDLQRKYPKTVKVEGGALRFRESLEVRVDDESQVPERFFKKVIDLDAVKEFIEATGGEVAGIAYGWKYGVSLYEDKT